MKHLHNIKLTKKLCFTMLVQIQECQEQSQLSAIDVVDGYNVFYFENQICYMGRKGQFKRLFNLTTTGYNLKIIFIYCWINSIVEVFQIKFKQGYFKL